MENKKQTAVEFLELQLIKNSIITNNDLKKAKEMEKQQIIETARFYFHERGKAKPEKYYNQEYGS